MHNCSRPDCSFCAKTTQLSLDERENSESNNDGTRLCGVDLMCSQLENAHSELSTQQSDDFLV